MEAATLPNKAHSDQRDSRGSVAAATDDGLNQTVILLFDQTAIPSSRPALLRPTRAAAVKDGRRPPRSGARVLDGREHDGTLDADGRP